AVQPRGKENDGYPPPRIMEVIAAAVDVLRMAGRVEGIVEGERLALMTVHVFHRVAELARQPPRAHEREVVRPTHRKIPRLASTHHVHVELRDNRVPRHCGVLREVS